MGKYITMKVAINVLIFMLCINFYQAQAQCKIASEVNANGTISQITPEAIIYQKESNTIFSQVRFDGSQYYFIWKVKPIVIDSSKTKNMEVVLDDETNLMFDFYDTYELAKDSTLNILFYIPNKHLEALKSHGINNINIVTDTGKRNFILVAHKNEISDQLTCLMKAVSPKKTKE